MSTYPVQIMLEDGTVAITGSITFADGAPLPAGWTQEGDPAAVDTNGGGLSSSVGDIGGPAVFVNGSGGWGVNIEGTGSSGNALAGTYITGTGDEGTVIKGSGSVYNGILIQGATTADGQADIILDANGSQGILLQNIPTSDPAQAGWIYNDSGTLKLSAG